MRGEGDGPPVMRIMIFAAAVDIIKDVWFVVRG